MSSLNVIASPWRALPSPDTTLEQLSAALVRFPDLRIEIGPAFDVTLVIAKLGAMPPATDKLADAMFGDENDATTIEESGVFQTLDFEIRDRHFEEDAEGV